jgi:hypothetical protein
MATGNVQAETKALVLGLVLASLALSACSSSTDFCNAGCLCYRTPSECPGPKGGCYPSYTASVDGSVPQFFCSNGPPLDASSQ